jgi:serine/threonine protein phosphatase 1
MTGPARIHAPSTGGRLVYAVGDIHGHVDQLDRLLTQIAADAVESATREPPLLVFLGDYVDRGPHSRAVIDRIIAAASDDRFEVVALKGNHEDAMVRFLSDPGFAPAWIANWGQATLASYGVAPPSAFDPAACEAVQARLAAVLPDSHRAFLAGLRLSVEVGDYLFVHAGIRPGVPLDAQAERDLIWIRYDFLESDEAFGKVVVHGHTPADRPERKLNRINIDTGVYFSGVLTAVRLEGEQQRFMQSYA